MRTSVLHEHTFSCQVNCTSRNRTRRRIHWIRPRVVESGEEYPALFEAEFGEARGRRRAGSPEDESAPVDRPGGLLETRLDAPALGGIRGGQQIEQVADLLVHLGGMAHLRASIDRVVIPATDLLALDEACLDEVGDDALRRALGDPDSLGDITEPHVAVSRDAEEYLRVVGHEPPRLRIFRT
jgi:hypothetical protein